MHVSRHVGGAEDYPLFTAVLLTAARKQRQQGHNSSTVRHVLIQIPLHGPTLAIVLILHLTQTSTCSPNNCILLFDTYRLHAESLLLSDQQADC